MPPFRRVEDSQAGPTALGILVPPGLRTFVILRPRAVEWDLLPLASGDGGGAFHPFEREEAAGVARRVRSALEQVVGGASPVRAVARADAGGFWVIARAGEWDWIACRRAPGRPYQPTTFASREEAEEAARRLTLFLCPGQDGNQEVYFNTQHFERRLS